MPEDPYLRRAVDAISAAGGGSAPAAPRFGSALLDAYSVAAASLGDRVVAPDPEVEHHLGEGAAIATASGLMSAPLDTHGAWWQEVPGPVVAGPEPEAVALLPGGVRPVEVAALTRARRRFRPGRPLPAGAVVLTGAQPAGSSWRGLLRWSVRGRGPLVALLLGASLVGGLTALLLPLATAGLFGSAVPGGELPSVGAILLMLALGEAGGALMVVARDILLIRLRDISDARLSPAVMAHLLKLPAAVLARMPTGELLNRTLSVQSARELVEDGIPSAILTAAFGLVNLGFLLAVDLRLGLLTTALVAAVVTLTVVLQVRARASLQEMLQQRSASDAMVMSLTDAIVPIRVAGAESRALARWAQLQSRALSAFGRRMRELDRVQPLLVGAPALLSGALVLGVVALAGPDFGSAAFMSAHVAVVQLTVAMGLLAQNLVRLWEIGPVLARSLPITTEPVERPGEARSPGRIDGRITLTDVVFGYDPQRPPLLRGVDIDIRPGEFVAVVGPSGGGKSTLLRLMLGFERPWSGVVSYDGQDLLDLDVAAVRRQTGTVLQACLPFGRTYRECIAGPLQIPDDRLWEILAEVGLAGQAREAGLDGSVGEGGAALSGGQRQRLMIARALVTEPRVVLLDEATSALDEITQAIVMNSILGRPVTRVAIAHRLSTVQRADRILVVSGGAIVESGTPAELLSGAGYFAALVKRQEF